jgi:hypothetical protein
MLILPDIPLWDAEAAWDAEARDFEKNPVPHYNRQIRILMADYIETGNAVSLQHASEFAALIKEHESPPESAPVLDDKWGSAIGVLLCVIFIAACIGDHINHNPMFVIIGAAVFVMAKCMSRSEPIRARYYRDLERYESKQPAE